MITHHACRPTLLLQPTSVPPIHLQQVKWASQRAGAAAAAATGRVLAMTLLPGHDTPCDVCTLRHALGGPPVAALGAAAAPGCATAAISCRWGLLLQPRCMSCTTTSSPCCCCCLEAGKGLLVADGAGDHAQHVEAHRLGQRPARVGRATQDRAGQGQSGSKG